MDPEVAARYPDLAANRPKWLENFKTSPDLCAMVCVFLATGAAANVLKGRYIDAEHDVRAYLDEKLSKEMLDHDLHTLRVSFIGGLQNDGGTASETFKFK